MKILKGMLFPLLTANVLALPNLVGAVGITPIDSHPSKPCPCSESGNKIDPLIAKDRQEDMGKYDVPMPVGGGGTVPACSTLELGNCTRQEWTWYQCIKISSSPLDCDLWKHPFSVWYCPGHTYYQCNGSWSYVGGDCAVGGAGCSQNTPTTLPVGCQVPAEPGWELCQ